MKPENIEDMTVQKENISKDIFFPQQANLTAMMILKNSMTGENLQKVMRF